MVSKAIRQRASVRRRLRSQVCAIDLWARGGKGAPQVLREVLHSVGEARLIAFDGEQEIAPLLLHHDPGRLGLGVQGVGRDQRALQLGSAEQLLRGGDFIGALGHRL
jgi:hypothetical protein